MAQILIPKHASGVCDGKCVGHGKSETQGQKVCCSFLSLLVQFLSMEDGKVMTKHSRRLVSQTEE